MNVDSWNDVLLIEKDRSMLAFLYSILIRSVFYQTVTGVQEDKTFLPVEHVYKGRLNIVSSRPEYEKKPDVDRSTGGSATEEKCKRESYINQMK